LHWPRFCRQLKQSFEKFSTIAEAFYIMAQPLQDGGDGVDGDGAVKLFLKIVGKVVKWAD